MYGICANIEFQLFVSSNDSKEDKKLKEMKMIVDKLSCKFDDRTEEQRSLKKIFWLPENTPEYQAVVQKVCCGIPLSRAFFKKNKSIHI